MSGLPVPCPTCDGNGADPRYLISTSTRECPVCKGVGLVVWAKRKMGRALAVDLEVLEQMVDGPLSYVRQTRDMLKAQVEAKVRTLGGDPREQRRPRFRSDRQHAIDWRDPSEPGHAIPAQAVFRYSSTFLIPEPYTGLVHREE